VTIRPRNNENSSKKRYSVIDEDADDTAAFWKIRSFRETSEWTDEQKDEAMDQAHRLAKHYIVVIKEHSEMQEANEKLKSELFELKNDNADLERELNIKQGQIEYLERRERRQETPSDSSMPTQGSKNRTRLKDPEKFAGCKDKDEDFETWKYDVLEKLKVDAVTFDDENHKISYVNSRTTGDAHEHIRDRVNDGEFTSAKEVLETLEVFYRDPHKAIKAKAAL